MKDVISRYIFICTLFTLFLGATLVSLSQNVVANSSSPEPLPVVSSSSGHISGSPYLQIPEDKLNWPAVIPPSPHVAEDAVDPTAAVIYEVTTQKVIRIPSAQQASQSGVASTPPYQGLLPNQGVSPTGPRSVLGGDDRQKITNTEDYPWRTVVKLYMTAADSTHWIGSGAIIGRSDNNGFHVLTAGHCVYMHDHGGWVSSIEVIPGLDGTYMPYYHAWATYFRTYTGWTDYQDWRHDWAVVTLDRRVGNYTGWMGRITSTDSNFYLMGFNCAGYPGDLGSGLSMYFDFDYGCDSDEYKHWYKMDTAGGQSGMPVWVYDYYGQGDRYIATVHAYGNDDHCSGGSNSGTRLNQDKYDRATTWVNSDTPPTDYADLIDDGQAWSGFSPTTVRAGDSFNVWSDVRNIGTASSGGFYVAYYASTNNIISTYDYLICEDYVSSINSFNYRNSDCSVTFPSSIPPGTYYVGWIIDSRNNVNEARDNGEANNTAYKDSYQLTVLPSVTEESRTAGAGAVRHWSDLGPEVSPAPQEGIEIPIGLENPETLGVLKGQPAPPLPAGVTAEEDPSASSPQPLAPSMVHNFEGLANSDNPGLNSGSYFRPPDPILAVGPNHVVVMDNSMFAVYNKAGVLVNKAGLKDWFSNVYTGSKYPFDPHIAYDHHQGHWLMMILIRDDTNTESWYLLSVSQTSDPTGAWWNWKLNGKLNYNGDDTWADYPHLGFDGISSGSGGAVYITSNQFTFGGSFKTAMLNILPKSALYSGSGFTYWAAWDRKNNDGTQAFTLRAAHTFGNPGREYLINTKSGGWDKVTLWRVNPTYPPTAVNWTRQATISIGSYSPPPNAVQKDGCGTLDTIDNRLYNAMYRNGKLYTAFTQSHNWGSGTVAAIHYLKIDTSSNTTDLNIIWGADGYYYFMPAIYTDSSNNIVFVFARSNSSEYAGIRYTGRKTSDSSTQGSRLLKAGEVCNTGHRWGDFFGIGNDPADGNKVWIYGEWAKDIPGSGPGGSDWEWGTWIGRVDFTFIEPTPTSAVFRVDSNGNVYADDSFYGQNFLSGSADIAEYINVSEPVESGDVLELDPARPGYYRKARGPYSALLAGVASTQPGFILGHSEDTEGKALLALIGIVPVKVTAEGGPIRPGDLLVASFTPGYAMRWDPESGVPCNFVGKALEALAGKRGVILVLLMAH